MSALKKLPETLINEKGMPNIGVSIWRAGDNGDTCRKCTVGEWLLIPENQSGTWRIDGGWGGPPGPIHVRWNESEQCWENGGFCGRNFKDREGDGPLCVNVVLAPAPAVAQCCEIIRDLSSVIRSQVNLGKLKGEDKYVVLGGSRGEISNLLEWADAILSANENAHAGLGVKSEQ